MVSRLFGSHSIFPMNLSKSSSRTWVGYCIPTFLYSSTPSGDFQHINMIIPCERSLLNIFSIYSNLYAHYHTLTLRYVIVDCRSVFYPYVTTQLYSVVYNTLKNPNLER